MKNSNHPTNLCIICNEYPPSQHGGIGTVSRELAEGLAEKGFNVTVIGVYNKFVLDLVNPCIEHINKVKVIRIPSSNLPLHTQIIGFIDRIHLYWWIHRENRKSHFNFIEVPDYEGMLPWGAPGRIPVVCRGHGSAFYFDAELNMHRASRLIYFFEKKTLQKANHLVFVSNYTAKKELELSHQNREYSVIYNSVDTSYFSPVDTSERIKGSILFINSIVLKKGVEPLMEAMNQVFHEFPDAHLLLLGKYSNPAYVQFLFSKLNNNYQERVKFLGHVKREEVLSYLRKANVCVFPSYSEAFAMGPLEAMATGSPVVFTQRASGNETLEDGVSGLLCDPYDPMDISQKITSILGDDALAMKLGANARQRVLEKFDKRHWIHKNIDYFNKIRNTS